MSSVRESEKTRNVLCVFCKTKVLEALEKEQFCFSHYMIYVESKLSKFIKISGARLLTPIEKQEINQLVDEHSRCLLRASKQLKGPKVWERKKCSRILQRLFAFRAATEMGMERPEMRLKELQKVKG